MELNEEDERAVDKALTLVEKGKTKKGREILNKLQEKHPRDHMVMYGLGVIHALEGEYEEAIKYFRTATEIFPYFIEAHFNLAIAYKSIFDLKNTVKHLKKVIDIGDSDTELVQQAQSLISSLGNIIMKTSNLSLEKYFAAQKKFEAAFSHMEKGEWEKAILGFEESLRINNDHQQSYGNLGICYAQLGEKSKAIAALDKALKIDPNYEPAIANKIMVERMQEGEKLGLDHVESIEYYKDYPLKKRSLLPSLFKRSGRER